MLSIQSLVAWQNLIFELPLLLAFIYQLLQIFGMGIGSDVVNIDTDVEVEVDMHDGGIVEKALSIFGVGKVPVSLIITCFFLTWGFTGLVSNRVFYVTFKLPLTLSVFFSFGIALLCSISFTRIFAVWMSKIIPSTESYVSKKTDLIGRTGKALYDITKVFGVVRVYDQYKTLLEVTCKIKPEDEEEVISNGSYVVLMSYNEEEACYYVRTDTVQQN